MDFIGRLIKCGIKAEERKMRRDKKLRERAKATIEAGKKVTGIVAVLMLTGCSYRTITGEQGYEWAFRMNPITKREEQQEFKPRVITFGGSKSSFGGEDYETMPK